MSHIEDISIFKDDDIYSQKCRIPVSLIKSATLKAGDIISVSCGNCFYICRVFVVPSTEPESRISFDDTVSCDFSVQEDCLNSKCLLFPDHFSVVKTTIFETLQVKLVLQDDVHNFQIKYKVYQKIVFQLLQNYIVGKNAILKCASLELANLFHIHSIIISETFHDDQVCGRLARTSNVEIIEVKTKEQSNRKELLKEVKNVKLGGMSNSYKLLKSFLRQKRFKSVIISGPSGCGKSFLVMKLYSSINCYFVMIDDDLTTDKCNACCNQLIQSSQMFPNQHSILFIDHIDKLTSYDFKGTENIMHIRKLLKDLQHINVLVIAATSQRRLLPSEISNLFMKEIFLGMPTFDQRKEILQAVTKSYNSNNIDYDKITGLTPGFIACDIVRLTQQAVNIRTNDAHLQKGLKEYTSGDSVGLSTEHFEKALLSISPSVLKTSPWNLRVKPVYWKDIGGMHQIKERLQLSIERPLRHPEIFEKVGLRCPRGVLLFGPPGCCKTTLARGLATECNANFFAANPSQIYSCYVGESEKNIAELFYQARLCAPSIIFLDELDSLVGRRDFASKDQGVSEKILSTLLNEMDGLGIKTPNGENICDEILSICQQPEDKKDSYSQKYLRDEVIVVGATNRPDCIDDALLRPGRFDVILYVPPPDVDERESILLTVSAGMPLHAVNFRKIAEKTQYFTGADLKNLCYMASMNALEQDMLNAKQVTEEHFAQLLEKMKPSVSREQIQIYEQLANRYGLVSSEQ